MKSDCKGNVFFQQSMIKFLFVQYQVKQVFPNSRFVLTQELVTEIVIRQDGQFLSRTIIRHFFHRSPFQAFPMQHWMRRACSRGHIDHVGHIVNVRPFYLHMRRRFWTSSNQFHHLQHRKKHVFLGIDRSFSILGVWCEIPDTDDIGFQFIMRHLLKNVSLRHEFGVGILVMHLLVLVK